MTSRRWTVLAAILGLTAALASTYPLVTRLGEAIPTPRPECTLCPDQLLTVWVVGESGRRLYRDPLHVFDANIFHPLRNTLAYSESMLSAGAIVAPLNAASGNPIFGFNVYWLATIALSFLGCFLLVREITADPRAGLVAGALFALTADRWAVVPHLGALSVHWVPFVLFAWIRLLGAPGWARGAGLAAAVVVHTHSSAYFGLMLPVLLVPWALVLAASGLWSLRRWSRTVGVFAIALVVSFLGYLPYLTVQQEIGYQPHQIFMAFSRFYWGSFANPLAYLQTVLSGSRSAGFASPLPFVLLIAAGAAATLRRVPSTRTRHERTHALALLAFWLAAAATSLGPTFSLGSLASGMTGPFAYLSSLPGFGSMRNPQRFLLLASFGAAALGGLAAAVLLRRIRSRRRAALVAAGLLALVFVDARTLRVPQPLTRLTTPGEIAPVYRWLAEATPPQTAILELPYGIWGQDARAMFHSLYHGRRLVNGYSATRPYFPEALRPFPSPVAIRTLQDAGVRYVIAHARDTEASRRLIARLEQQSELAGRWIGSSLLLEVPAAHARPPRLRGVPLGSRAWRLEGSEPGVERIVDGDPTTHWIARVGEADSFLRIDLGAEHTLTGVVLELGAHILEFPRVHSLWSSVDGDHWDQAVPESITVPPFASYRANRRNVELQVPMPPTLARYLEIRVPKRRDPMSRATWSVHELRIHAERAAGGRTAAPQKGARAR